MWNRIKQLPVPGMKSRTQDTTNDQSHAPEVLASVREQHPNLSVFHDQQQARSESPTPPMPSPIPIPIEPKGSRRFTLKPKRKDDDPLRIRSPSPGPQTGILKKKSSPNMSESQPSLSRAGAKSPEVARGPSQDLLRPSIDSSRSTPSGLRRPSLDMLRSLEPYHEDNDISQTPFANDGQYGSVRSILREPNTPGTGQNVRFFSRDAYKVMTPEQSMDLDSDALPQPHFGQTFQPPSLPQAPSPLVEADLPAPSDSFVLTHKSPKRPTLSEVFSPIGGVSDSSMSFSDDAGNIAPISATSAPDTSNPFNVSQDFELPSFPPPGLDVDFQSPSFNVIDSPQSDDSNAFHRGIRTSTPNVFKGKGKEREEKENRVPMEVNEAIFHSREKSPKLPSALHERSQSFSLGQSVFFSARDDKSNRSSNTSSVFSSIHSNDKASRTSTESPSPSPLHGSLKGRSRALSDTVFHSMLSKSSGSISRGANPPEVDINDESSTDIVMYTAKTPEPDPFSAHATTYYTPQTMIPVTPPKGSQTHARKASKEETTIFALQTQLAMQTEICGQYETDLRARDELVELLRKRCDEIEREEVRRKGLLRGWKKKVAELERTCRYLEEEVDSSRQESLNRSALDEASGFALAAMQDQIAVLQRDRSSWQRKEEMFREQFDKMESALRERNEEVVKLKEAIRTRDDSERELQRGIQAAQEQMEQLSNMSMGFVNEEDLQKAVQEKEEEKEKFEAAEAEWESERAEYELKIERHEIEKAAMKAEVDAAKKEVEDDQDELRMLKTEVEAQWRHAEKASEKLATLQDAKAALEKERDDLQQDIHELHQRIDRMEVDYTDSSNKCSDLERKLAELWDRHADLENERNELQKRLDSDETAQLVQAIQERDRHIEQLVESHHDDLDQMEASHTTNQANLREELEAELARVRDECHSEVSRLRQDRDQEKAELQARSRREEEKAYHDKMTIRQERDRALQDVARLEDQNADLERLKTEMAQLRGQIQELKNDSANKDMTITSLEKQREQEKADIEGLNIALDSKQQELELIKRQIGGKGTAGATPARPSATTQRRQSSMSSVTTPRSRPSSMISDSGGRDSVLSSSSTTNWTKTSNEKPVLSRNPILSKSTRANAFGTPTPSGPPNKLSSSMSTKLQRSSIEGSMGPPPDKLLTSTGGPGLVGSRVASLNKTVASRPSSTASNSSSTSTPQQRRPSTLSTQQTLAKAKPAPTKAPIVERTEESDYDQEKENLKLSRTKIPAAA